MQRGITITNYLSNGDPEGIIFCYVSNWSGQAIKIPRNLFAESKDLNELQRPGLYFLIGQNVDNPDDKIVYVGEANNLSERIIYHLRDSEKSFAEIIICFCSKDEILTVSHTKYLEQKTIQHLSKSNEYRMMNKKEGSMINLPRMVQDEMDTFFDNMRIILPTLGYSLLHTEHKILVSAKKSQMDTLYLEIGGYKAIAKLTSNGLEVQKGSQMKLEETPSISGSYSNLRKTLAERGIVTSEAGKYIFKESYEFSSSSTAAAILLGYSINGRTAWKNKLGKTLKELEEEELENN